MQLQEVMTETGGLMVIKVIIFLLLAGIAYSQGLTGHYSSILKKRVVAATSDVTDSLWYYFDDDDLTNGTVISGEWIDRISSLALDVTGDPQMTDSGVVFDGNDYLEKAQSKSLGTAFSIEYVLTCVDTATPNQSFGGVSNTKSISAGMVNSRIAIRGYDTGNTFAQFYSSVIYNTPSHLIATFDGDTIKVYVNGTERTRIATAAAGAAYDNARFHLGSSEGTNIVRNGTIFRLARFYNKELTSGEVSTRYNHSSVQGKLP